jgi:hypothetical protein
MDDPATSARRGWPELKSTTVAREYKTMKTGNTFRAVLLTIAGAAMIGTLSAAPTLTPYEDLDGQFMIDLPQGYQLATKVEKMFYSFKGDGPDVLLYYEKKQKDLTQAGEMLITTVKDQLKNAKPGPRSEAAVNGHPATFVIYTSTMVVPVGNPVITNVTVELFAMNGSVRLKKGALSFASIYSAEQKKQFEETLQKSFQSIRDVGEAVPAPKPETKDEKKDKAAGK